jgi:hypothetical protein
LGIEAGADGTAEADLEVEAALEEEEEEEVEEEAEMNGDMEGEEASEEIKGAEVETNSEEAKWVQLRESRDPITSQVIDLRIRSIRLMTEFESKPEQARLDRDLLRRLL